jgi:hypothetical protein
MRCVTGEPGTSAPKLADAIFAPVSPVPDVQIPPDSRCRSLMRAVLTDAVEIVRKFRRSNCVKRRALVAETRAWFESHDTSWPFAFESICDAFGLDPDAVRGELEKANYVSPDALRRRKYQQRRARIVPLEAAA